MEDVQLQQVDVTADEVQENNDLREWVEVLADVKFKDPVEWMNECDDGIALCKLGMGIEPGLKLKYSKMAKIFWMKRDNVLVFVKWLNLHLDESIVFDITDLLEQENTTTKNHAKVKLCLASLATWAHETHGTELPGDRRRARAASGGTPRAASQTPVTPKTDHSLSTSLRDATEAAAEAAAKRAAADREAREALAKKEREEKDKRERARLAEAERHRDEEEKREREREREREVKERRERELEKEREAMDKRDQDRREKEDRFRKEKEEKEALEASSRRMEKDRADKVRAERDRLDLERLEQKREAEQAKKQREEERARKIEAEKEEQRASAQAKRDLAEKQKAERDAKEKEAREAKAKSMAEAAAKREKEAQARKESAEARANERREKEREIALAKPALSNKMDKLSKPREAPLQSFVEGDEPENVVIAAGEAKHKATRGQEYRHAPGDDIDLAVEQEILGKAAELDPQGLVGLVRVKRGQYLLLPQKKLFHIKLVSGNPMVRVGGGFVPFETWYEKVATHAENLKGAREPRAPSSSRSPVCSSPPFTLLLHYPLHRSTDPSPCRQESADMDLCLRAGRTAARHTRHTRT